MDSIFTQTANVSIRQNDLSIKNRKMLQSKRNRLTQIWKMSYIVIFLSLFTGVTTQLDAQSVVNRNECGDDSFIQAFIRGVEGTSVPNEIRIPAIAGFQRAYAEVWVTSSECSPFPNTLQLTSNTGEVVNATFTNIADPGGVEQERVYRAVFNQALRSVEVTRSGGCTDIVSILLSVESRLENSSSFLVEFDRELHGGAANQNDCISFSLNVGAEDVARDFVVSIPIHEKDVTTPNRFVDYTVTSGSNEVSERRFEQNAGPEAALYNATIRVPRNENVIRIEVCSPLRDGDSFGLGAIVVSSTDCPNICEPMPDIAISTTSDPVICQGATIALSANTSGGIGQCVIQWQRRAPGGSFQNFANGERNLTVGTGFLSSPGNYEFRARYTCDGLGCEPSVSEIIAVEVVEGPEVRIATEDDLEICLGATVDFTASVDGGLGDCNLQWQQRVGTSGPWLDTNNGNAGTGFLNAAGSFQYRALYDCDGSGCDEAISNVLTIVVFADPSVTLEADDLEICVGETVSFDVSTEGGVGTCELVNERRVGTSGPWEAFGSVENFEQQSIFQTPGTYQFRSIYNCDGSECDETISNIVTIEVSPDPEVSIEADELEICLGESVSLTARVDGGTGNCAIQWQRRPQGGTWTDFSDGRETITNGIGFLSGSGIFQYRAIYNCDGSGCDEDISNVINVEVVAKSIGSNVFVDNNNNGIRDADEPGIEGITVQIFNTGADGIAENGDDQFVGSDVTDANGDYFVGELVPGDYYGRIDNVDPDFPASSTPTNLTPDDNVDNDDNGIQDGIGQGVWSNVITLSEGDEPTDEPGSGGDQDDNLVDSNGNMTLDFGFTPLLSIGSLVFVDNEDNGVFDGTDERIPGVTVQVFSFGPDGIPETADDVLAGSDVTNNNGLYFIDGLVPGDSQSVVQDLELIQMMM